jgi:hypothetical protein
MKILSKLLTVKSVVTFVVLAVFTQLALRGEIPVDTITTVTVMVISFYFGVQHEKKGGQ